jgi:hypothetical protein
MQGTSSFLVWFVVVSFARGNNPPGFLKQRNSVRRETLDYGLCRNTAKDGKSVKRFHLPLQRSVFVLVTF